MFERSRELSIKTMNNCIFCKIANKEIPSNIVHESENLIAFPDIDPSADIHILIVPKKHIDGISHIKASEEKLLAQVYTVAKALVKEYNLENNAYRIVVNGGKAQHVPHLHFHLLGGKFKKQI